VSIAIVGPRDVRHIKTLEKHVGKPFVQKNVPTAAEIIAKQLFTHVDKVEKTEVDLPKINPYLDIIYKKLAHMSREELIQHFISVEFNRFIEYYRDAKDLNLGAANSGRGDRPERSDRFERKDRQDRPERAERGDRPEKGERFSGRHASDTRWTGFTINLGHKHRLNPQRLMGLINESDTLSGAPIGRIEIQNGLSYFEIGGELAEFTADELSGMQIGGVTIQVNQASGKDFSSREIKRGGVRGSRPFGDSRPPRADGKDFRNLKPKSEKKDKKDKKEKKAKKKESQPAWA
jgi:ATP-dependent RNA helicase DeaD